MTPWLEIIIPIHNPGPALAKTVDSLVAQADRGFGVVLSDNHSSAGLEHLESAQRVLEGAGIPARRVRPPYSLGRVEHWNWAHAQGAADWLKPLFVGDLLKPDYAARVRRRVSEQPRARVVRCDFEVLSAAGTSPAGAAPGVESRLTPEQFLAYYPALGNWIGGPVNLAYHRDAWRAVGGYPVQLPACGDYHLYALLILHFGLEIIREPLAVFYLHEQRFSFGITKRRVHGCFELWLILRQTRNYSRSAKLPWPEHGVGRGLWKQMKVDYWHPWKARWKKRLTGG